LFVTISGGTNKNRSHYVAYVENNKNVPFHKGITGFEMTDHINRYPMDNRRCNLRETNAVYNNRNRMNYHSEENNIQTSIQFDTEHEIWNACMTIDGIMKMKSFPIHQIDYEKAKYNAHQWCEETIDKYKKNPITGVTFAKEENNFRSRIRVNNEQFEQRFSVSQYGYDVAKQMAIDWRTEMAQKTDNYVSRPNETMTHRHPDFDKLRSEFENIMIEHATGLQWKK
jgi:hypothetical protein